MRVVSKASIAAVLSAAFLACGGLAPTISDPAAAQGYRVFVLHRADAFHGRAGPEYGPGSGALGSAEAASIAAAGVEPGYYPGYYYGEAPAAYADNGYVVATGGYGENEGASPPQDYAAAPPDYADNGYAAAPAAPVANGYANAPAQPVASGYPAAPAGYADNGQTDNSDCYQYRPVYDPQGAYMGRRLVNLCG